MNIYRKKPVVVEVEQFVLNNIKDVPFYVEYFGQRFIVRCDKQTPYIELPTLEGIMRAYHLDYIIKGVKGELYSCKEDVFRITYELVK